MASDGLNKSKKNSIIAIVSSILLGGGGYGIDEYINYKIDTRIEVNNEHEQANKSGSFRSELGDRWNIPAVDVPRELDDIRNIVKDSINAFRNAFLPMLLDERKFHDVGIKAKAGTNELIYLHINGRYYQPIWDATHFRYKFYNDSKGIWMWCL